VGNEPPTEKENVGHISAMSRVRAFWNARTPTKRVFFVVVLALVAVGGTVTYRLYTEVERRRLEVAMATQADRGLYLYQMFNFGNLPTASRECQRYPPDRGSSWLVEILPYIEGAALTMKIDFNQPWDTAANSDIRALKFTPISTDPKKWAFHFSGGPGSTDASPLVAYCDAIATIDIRPGTTLAVFAPIHCDLERRAVAFAACADASPCELP
jgi:hypothetical protein